MRDFTYVAGSRITSTAAPNLTSNNSYSYVLLGAVGKVKLLIKTKKIASNNNLIYYYKKALL